MNFFFCFYQIPTDDSSQRENSERKRSYEKGKSSKTAASPVIAPGVDGITGYTIPPSIFNDIPDIDLCTLMETSTTATSTVTARKRHSKHQLVHPLIHVPVVSSIARVHSVINQ